MPEGVETQDSQGYQRVIVEPAILDKLYNQQWHKFYDFRQYHVSSKIQTAFVTGTKV